MTDALARGRRTGPRESDSCRFGVTRPAEASHGYVIVLSCAR